MFRRITTRPLFRLSGAALYAALLLTVAVREGHSSDRSDAGADSSSIIEPVAPVAPKVGPAFERGPVGVDWSGVLRGSLRFLALEHSFRLLTEPGTREGLNQIPRGYLNSLSNLHGWADGDEFYVNYVGHPMQGSAAGFIWAQNDRRFRHVEFGLSRSYWKSRARATAFSLVYSLQFEVGPVSEASLGQIQAHHPQVGFVDHVVTPSLGLGWMVAEDALDLYVIRWIETRTANGYARALIRSSLNPTRTLANVMNGRVPWARDSRERAFTGHLLARERPREIREPAGDPRPGVAPFEFSAASNYRNFMGSAAGGCLGAGASGAFRIAPAWQLVADVSGCNLGGLGPNTSGDSIRFLMGPRWAPMASRRWNPYVQLMTGVQKLTIEEVSPEKKRAMELNPVKRDGLPPRHAEYAQQIETSGLSLGAGAGLDVKLHDALALRLASVDYTHSWVSNLAGNRYRSELNFTSGVVLRFGTW